MESGKTLAGSGTRHVAGGLHRPLPVLLQGAKRAGQRRLHQNSQRRPGHRAPPEPDLYGRRPRQALFREPFRATGLHRTGETFRTLPAQRHHRRRLRRRHRFLRSQSTKKSSARKPTTCAWTTPCLKAPKLKVRPRRSSPAAAWLWTPANSSVAPAPASSSAAKPIQAFSGGRRPGPGRASWPSENRTALFKQPARLFRTPARGFSLTFAHANSSHQPQSRETPIQLGWWQSKLPAVKSQFSERCWASGKMTMRSSRKGAGANPGHYKPVLTLSFPSCYC